MSDYNSKSSPVSSQPLTPDEQRYVDAMRSAHAAYFPISRDDILRLLAIIDRLTTPPAAAAPQPAIAWAAPAPADAAEWLDKPFTKVAPAPLTPAQWWYDTLDSAPYYETDARQLSNMACGPFATQADALADQAKRKPAAPAPTVKLTAAQRKLLQALTEGEIKRSWMQRSYYYKPAQGNKSINNGTVDYCKQHGLIESETRYINDRRYEVLTITAAGRRALAEGR